MFERVCWCHLSVLIRDYRIYIYIWLLSRIYSFDVAHPSDRCKLRCDRKTIPPSSLLWLQPDTSYRNQPKHVAITFAKIKVVRWQIVFISLWTYRFFECVTISESISQLPRLSVEYHTVVAAKHVHANGNAGLVTKRSRILWAPVRLCTKIELTSQRNHLII